MRLGAQAFGSTHAVAEEPQVPLRGQPRVQEADAAGGDVSRIRIELVAALLAQLVEADQFRVSHVDFAAVLQQRRRRLGVQPQGDVRHRADVLCDVVPDFSIAPRGGLDELAAFARKRNGHTVDLELDDPLYRLAGE